MSMYLGDLKITPAIITAPSTSVVELNATINGTYTAPSGSAYSPVIVNVPVNGSTCLYGMENPTLVYNTNYSFNLSETNYSTITPSTTATYLKLPNTTYSTSGGTSITVDRWGINYHDGTLDWTNYDYIIISSGKIDVKYSVPESQLTMPHILYNKTYIIYYQYSYKGFLNSTGEIASTENTSSNSYIYRGYNHIFSTPSGTNPYSTSTAYYGIGTQYGPSNSYSQGGSYIDLVMSSYYVRASTSYHDLTAYDYIDADNTKFYGEWKIYRCDKPYFYKTLIQNFNDSLAISQNT